METRTVTLSVKGMHCSGCASRVESALEDVEGVQGVRVSLDDEEATVEAGGRAAGDALVQAVEEAGYEASLAS